MFGKMKIFKSRFEVNIISKKSGRLSPSKVSKKVSMSSRHWKNIKNIHYKRWVRLHHYKLRLFVLYASNIDSDSESLKCIITLSILVLKKFKRQVSSICSLFYKIILFLVSIIASLF